MFAFYGMDFTICEKACKDENLLTDLITFLCVCLNGHVHMFMFIKAYWDRSTTTRWGKPSAVVPLLACFFLARPEQDQTYCTCAFARSFQHCISFEIWVSDF